MEVVYKGHTVSINENLLEKNNVWQNLKSIVEIRIEIEILIENTFHLSDVELKNKGKLILNDLTILEFRLQTAWGFPQDKNYHTYQWYGLNGCTCPVLDNRELSGTGMRWHNGYCPYHNNT